MSGMQELADAIWRTEDTVDFGGYTRRDAQAVADHLWAEGYRKHRTVNSANELDDLSEGSVIRTAQGAVFEKTGALWVVSQIHFGKASHYAKFPAIVLFDSDGD